VTIYKTMINLNILSHIGYIEFKKSKSFILRYSNFEISITYIKREFDDYKMIKWNILDHKN